jgi:hypothetical protein
MPRPTIEDDEAAFVKTLTQLGRSAGNVRLRERLGWTDDRYWRTHSSLLDEGKVIRGRGKGGSVALIEGNEGAAEAATISSTGGVSTVSEPVAVPREVDLYEPAKAAIEAGWIKERGFDDAIVEITALPGRRYTGGTWTRPDLAVVATKAYPYLPGRSFEIVTFEVKTADAIDVTGVFEALSHLQFASLSYVIFSTNGRDFEDYPDTARILNLAKQHGVGVIAASDIKDYTTWDQLVDPRHNILDPEQANLFIGTCFTEETKSCVVKWAK